LVKRELRKGGGVFGKKERRTEEKGGKCGGVWKLTRSCFLLKKAGIGPLKKKVARRGMRKSTQGKKKSKDGVNH